MRGALVAGLLLAALPAAADGEPAAAAAVLKKHCVECHGGAQVRAGLRVLDFQDLRDRQLVRPHQPDASELLQLVDAGSMPPGRKVKLTRDEAGQLRDWIKSGAADVMPDSPDAPVLRAIAADLRQQLDKTPADVPFLRYVSFYHLPRDKGPDPDTCSDLLTYGLNLLSSQPDPVRPERIAGADDLVFRINLKNLGWDATPFATSAPQNQTKPLDWNLYDLLLLEYPLAPVRPELPGEQGKVLLEYLRRAAQVRPVPYLRGDWLLAAALRPPLYEDLRQLPYRLTDLAASLEVEGKRTPATVRAGLLRSTTAPGRRRVVRHACRGGFFWRTFDQVTPTAAEKEEGDAQATRRLLYDAVRCPDTDSQVVFSLPNGLPAFFVADRKGQRRASAPGADGKPIDNGLTCARCHREGPFPLTDAVQDAVDKLDLAGKDKDAFTPPELRTLKEMYRGQLRLDEAVGKDRKAVAAALRKVLGRDDVGDPAAVIVERFRADAPPPADCLPPLDGLTLPDWPSPPRPAGLEFTAWNYETGKESYAFTAEQKVFFKVENNLDKPVFFEMFYLSDGTAALAQRRRRLNSGDTYQYPRDRPNTPRDFEPIGPVAVAGTDSMVLFASFEEFPEGVPVFSRRGKDDWRGWGRVIHPWYGKPGEPGPADLKQVIKKTLVIETKPRP